MTCGGEGKDREDTMRRGEEGNVEGTDVDLTYLMMVRDWPLFHTMCSYLEQGEVVGNLSVVSKTCRLALVGYPVRLEFAQPLMLHNLRAFFSRHSSVFAQWSVVGLDIDLEESSILSLSKVPAIALGGLEWLSLHNAGLANEGNESDASQVAFLLERCKSLKSLRLGFAERAVATCSANCAAALTQTILLRIERYESFDCNLGRLKTPHQTAIRRMLVCNMYENNGSMRCVLNSLRCLLESGIGGYQDPISPRGCGPYPELGRTQELDGIALADLTKTSELNAALEGTLGYSSEGALDALLLALKVASCCAADDLFKTLSNLQNVVDEDVQDEICEGRSEIAARRCDSVDSASTSYSALLSEVTGEQVHDGGCHVQEQVFDMKLSGRVVQPPNLVVRTPNGANLNSLGSVDPSSPSGFSWSSGFWSLPHTSSCGSMSPLGTRVGSCRSQSSSGGQSAVSRSSVASTVRPLKIRALATYSLPERLLSKEYSKELLESLCKQLSKCVSAPSIAALCSSVVSSAGRIHELGLCDTLAFLFREVLERPVVLYISVSVVCTTVSKLCTMGCSRTRKAFCAAFVGERVLVAISRLLGPVNLGQDGDPTILFETARNAVRALLSVKEAAVKNFPSIAALAALCSSAERILLGDSELIDAQMRVCQVGIVELREAACDILRSSVLMFAEGFSQHTNGNVLRQVRTVALVLDIAARWVADDAEVEVKICECVVQLHAISPDVLRDQVPHLIVFAMGKVTMIADDADLVIMIIQAAESLAKRHQEYVSAYIELVEALISENPQDWTYYSQVVLEAIKGLSWLRISAVDLSDEYQRLCRCLLHVLDEYYSHESIDLVLETLRVLMIFAQDTSATRSTRSPIAKGAQNLLRKIYSDQHKLHREDIIRIEGIVKAVSNVSEGEPTHRRSRSNGSAMSPRWSYGSPSSLRPVRESPCETPDGNPYGSPPRLFSRSKSMAHAPENVFFIEQERRNSCLGTARVGNN